jgi:Flp pilus assembly protein TadD
VRQFRTSRWIVGSSLVLACGSGCTQQVQQTAPGALPTSSVIESDTPQRVNAATYFAHGQLLERQGAYDRALSQYELALKAQPNLVGARNRIGITMNKMGRHREATEMFRLAIAALPTQAQFHNNLGFSLYLEGDLTGAEAALKRALELKPDFARAQMNYAVVAAKLGRFEEAHTLFAKVCTPADAAFNIGMLLTEAAHYAEAAQYLEAALTSNPNLEAARVQLNEVARLAAGSAPARPIAPTALMQTSEGPLTIAPQPAAPSVAAAPEPIAPQPQSLVTPAKMPPVAAAPTPTPVPTELAPTPAIALNTPSSAWALENDSLMIRTISPATPAPALPAAPPANEPVATEATLSPPRPPSEPAPMTSEFIAPVKPGPVGVVSHSTSVTVTDVIVLTPPSTGTTNATVTATGEAPPVTVEVPPAAEVPVTPPVAEPAPTPEPAPEPEPAPAPATPPANEKPASSDGMIIRDIKPGDAPTPIKEPTPPAEEPKKPATAS